MKDLLFLIAIWAMQLGAFWVWDWWHTPKPEPPMSDAEVESAVLDAAVAVGLPRDQLTGSYDLARTGKLYEVLHHAAIALGKDHELRTVKDVCDWLIEAPKDTP